MYYCAVSFKYGMVGSARCLALHASACTVSACGAALGLALYSAALDRCPACIEARLFERAQSMHAKHWRLPLTCRTGWLWQRTLSTSQRSGACPGGCAGGLHAACRPEWSTSQWPRWESFSQRDRGRGKVKAWSGWEACSSGRRLTSWGSSEAVQVHAPALLLGLPSGGGGAACHRASCLLVTAPPPLLPLELRYIPLAVEQGSGRFTEAELVWLVEESLDALSAVLGHQPFLLGSAPLEVDASAFGLLHVLLRHKGAIPQLETLVRLGWCRIWC